MYPKSWPLDHAILTPHTVQGPWAPKKIANPDYFLDESPLANLGSIGGVAIEIWTMDEGYLFSNVLIANDAAEAEQKRTSLWAPKKEAEVGVLGPLTYTACMWQDGGFVWGS